jgi:uncharacterized membrane protein
MKPRNLYRIIIGVVMITSGIVSLLLSAGEAIISTMLLAAGFAFLITGISRHSKYGDEPESDERSKKISAYGITYAWLTGLFFVTGLFWLDYLDLVRLSTQNALTLSVVVLALSAVIYQTYLFRKGDVE